MPSLRTSVCLFTLGAVSAAASADFLTPSDVEMPWERGVTEGSTYAEWNFFQSPIGPNPPDVGEFPAFNPDETPWDVMEIGTTSSFVTSTGNIYSFSEATEFLVTIPTEPSAGSTTTVLVQTRVLGVEIDPDTVRIDGVEPASVEELERIDLGDGQFGGVQVDTLWRFELESAPEIRELQFAASAPSMSLDRLAIDTVAREAAGGPCNAADIAAPFGLLDGADVNAFISAFGAEQVPADLAAPFGLLDGADVNAFISAFGAGCP